MLKVLGRSFYKSLSTCNISELSYASRNLLTTELLIQIPCRTTFILKRKHPVPLLKKYADPNTYVPKKKRNRLYELVHFTEVLPEGNIKVLLKQLVPGIGEKGDVVSLKRTFAYNELLLPGLAEYASDEAITLAEEKAKNVVNVDEDRFSSLHVHRTINVLRLLIVSVVMHQENSWVLEPWHIRASCRKAGVHIMSDDCIELPKQKIEGPNLDIEGKEFLVNITINNKEKAQLRCRIHHWHPDIMKRLPPVPLHWTKPAEPLFKEEAEILASMPLPPIPKNALSPNQI